MKSEALKALSWLIPEDDAIVAITWFSAEIQLLAARRNANEGALTFSGASPAQIEAYRDATDDLLTFAHSMDWSICEPDGSV